MLSDLWLLLYTLDANLHRLVLVYGFAFIPIGSNIMSHLPPTSVIEEVNCLIVKDILLHVWEVFFSVGLIKLMSARQRGLFELTAEMQNSQRPFPSLNSNIL